MLGDVSFGIVLGNVSFGIVLGKLVNYCMTFISSNFKGTTDNESLSYSDLMHAGRMTHPSRSFINDTKKFYEYFCTVHPKNDISREPGIITGFANLLLTNFPDYDYKVLYLVSKILTVIRLREVNNLVFKRRLLDRKAKKKGEDRPYSTRGRIQLGRLSANT